MQEDITKSNNMQEDIIKVFPFLSHLIRSNELMEEANKEMELFISEGCKSLGMSKEELVEKYANNK